jgi:hypothetical protein
LRQLQNAHAARLLPPVPQKRKLRLRYAPNAIRSLRVSRNLSTLAEESTDSKRDTAFSSFSQIKGYECRLGQPGLLFCYFLDFENDFAAITHFAEATLKSATSRQGFIILQ